MTRPYLALIIGVMQRLTTRKTPPRLVSITLSNSSSDILMSSVSLVIPALATRTLIGPQAASTSAIALSRLELSVTSALTVIEPSGPLPERAVTAT
ncbi:unannotated protein [freshwater metagenome]|uniref:Unannotated protein n=1 Tax=freshwater metagenome TaxID=449393 RepID=A0A6J6KNU4_9ZZZZ